ncbi:MAG TPA: methionine ABC transporter substrate-binding protein, partial [Acidaminococcaceae bacterium]|nr:methionine ABC transporter substrate-binding protein [Acidaminococcaceae bacterium]
PIGNTILMRMGIYSDKVRDLKAVPDGATVAIPNDPTNGGRGLLLLQQAGLLKLKDGTVYKATPKDVVENPKHLKFKELEAAQLPRSLDDVDLATITMNYVLSSGIDVKKQGLFWERKDEPLAVMVLAAREQDKDRPEFKKIVAIYKSDAIKKFIEEKFHGTITSAN